MTPDRNDETAENDAEHGVLADAGTLETTGIGILGAGTAQVRVVLPGGTDDDLVADDDVVVDEVHVEVEELATGDIVLEDPSPAEPARAGDPDVHDAEELDADVVHHDADDTAAPVADAAVRTEDGRATDPEPVERDPAPAERSAADPASGTHVPEPRSLDATAADAGATRTAPAAPPQTEPAVASAAAEESAVASPSPAPAERAPDRVASASPVTASTTTTPAAAPADPAADRALERPRPAPAELALASKRLGEIDDTREGPDLLTADRLLGRAQRSGAEPEGVWQQLVYALSGRRIRLGDGRRVRERRELDRRIAAALPGGARFVPVLSRKGGVGKTTITTLLGMALAAARDDRVIAVDANPDRGTLADRIGRPSGRTVRDLARTGGEVSGFHDISTIVARDETRLDVLASDADPRVSEAFSDRDYRDVAALAAHYYSIVLTDTGTGIVHSVMAATLERADVLVVVAGLSIDEARLASETLTWLETNGYAEQVRRAVVVLNTSRPGASLVRDGEVEAHFRTRVRTVVRMPYDPLIGVGGAISFRDLQPATRQAARELAAAVVEGLRSLAPAA